MPKILIVDDEPGALEILEACIEDTATTIYKALDGKEGWETYIKVKPDIVITDYRMPGYNGLELATMIKKENPTCPIVLVSGCMNINDEMNSHFTMTFRKPFNIPQFRKSILALSEKIES